MAYIPPNSNGQATMANSAPVTIASNQSAIPVSNSSLPLPTGASTSAKQPALGTAGSASTDVITVQGIASGVAQPVSGTFWQATQPVSLATNTPVIAAGSAIIGSVKVTDGTNTGAVKAASTAAAATDPSVVVNISPNSPAHPVTVSSGTVTAVTAITNALPAGTNLMGKVGIDQTTVGTTNAVSIAQLGTTTVATGNGVSTAGVQRVALVSDQTTNTNPLYTKQQAQTAGGATPFQLISAATTNATSVKASAGTVYGVQAFNNSATVAFLKLYNKATAPTVGTDTPVKTIMIPANGGAVLPITDIGVAFGTGIALAVTGLATVADTTAVALSQCQIGIDYA